MGKIQTLEEWLIDRRCDDFNQSSLIKHLDSIVLKQFVFHDNFNWISWSNIGGKHKNVLCWVLLDDCHAVGFNENVNSGYSFPVVRPTPNMIRILEADKIDLQKLLEICNPLTSARWVGLNDIPITLKEIETYVNSDMLQSPDVLVELSMSYDISSRDTHLKRIAWLVKNYSNNYPIMLDFGVPALGNSFCFEDGMHRYHAAIYRNESYITASCSGSIEIIEQYKYKVGYDI